jgi:hypothetical protein
MLLGAFHRSLRGVRPVIDLSVKVLPPSYPLVTHGRRGGRCWDRARWAARDAWDAMPPADREGVPSPDELLEEPTP